MCVCSYLNLNMLRILLVFPQVVFPQVGTPAWHTVTALPFVWIFSSVFITTFHSTPANTNLSHDKPYLIFNSYGANTALWSTCKKGPYGETCNRLSCNRRSR